MNSEQPRLPIFLQQASDTWMRRITFVLPHSLVAEMRPGLRGWLGDLQSAEDAIDALAAVIQWLKEDPKPLEGEK